MTRPMPGPPECLPTGFPHEVAAINAPGCLLHARSYNADSKRLAITECADEYWRADDDFLGSTPFTSEMLRAYEKVRVWGRFASYLHALEPTL